jgi:hypothetical protein
VATVASEGGPGAVGASSAFERPFVELDRLAAPDVSGRLWADAD